MSEQRTTFEEPALREWTPWDVWRIVLKRRWLVGEFVLIAVLIAGVLAFSMTPIYRATCKISIERKGAKILEHEVMAMESNREAYESFYNTEYAILRNPAVIERAVDKLKLEHRPHFAPDGPFFKPGLLRGLKKDVVALIGTRKRNKKPIDPRKFYRRWIAAGLTISPQRHTQLVDIHFDCVEPGIAAEVANAIAEAYIDFSLEKKLDIARQSGSFIAEQIFDLRKATAKEERLLQEYARKHGIVTGDDRDVARQHLASLQEGYTTALGETAARKAAYLSARTADPASLAEVRSDPLVADLNRNIARKEEQYNNAVQVYGAAYPELQKMRRGLEDLRRSLHDHTKRLAAQVVESRQDAYKEAQSRTEQLAALVEQAKTRVDELEQAMIEYEQLRFELDRKKMTLQNLLSRRSDMLLAASMGEDTPHNVRIINRAEPPDSIHSPNKRRMLALGLLLGLMAGIGCAVLIEALDDTLKGAEDASQALDLLVVGEIPAVEGARKKHKRRAGRRRKSAASKGPTRVPALITVTQPRSPAAEAYRELRTAILSADSGEPLRSVFITSSQPGEGKTTTAINLAAALGQVGRSVLLLDTDLRRPNCHRILQIRAKEGISHYLKQDLELESLLQQTPLERVWLLPAGPIPPDPAELLDSPRFIELVAEARGLICPQTGRPFDHLVFDTPPVLSVVDPILIGRHAEGGLLVLKSGVIRRKSAQAARQKLLVARVNLVGAVVNALDLEDGHYGYRYYYYYSHGREGEKGTRKRVRHAPSDDESRPQLEAHLGGRSKKGA